ncbi:18879_t:CDS:2, partial [Dentiscutata erythropus]
FDKDIYNNNEDFQEISNFDSKSELSEEENDVFFNIQESQFDPKTIIKEIKNIIYNSLFEYWDYMSQICLLLILLDSQLRKITFAKELPISSNPTNISSNNMFKDIVFGESKKSQDSINELDYYLDFRQTSL